MTVRIATYNVNNLFERARVLNLTGFSEKAAEVLADVQTLNELLEKDVYDAATKTEIKIILEKYNFHKQGASFWFKINEARGRLYRVRKNPERIEIAARGRGDWLGWVELVREQSNEASRENTARVLNAVNADINCLVEVEDRLTLSRFNKEVLGKFQTPYKHNLLIDGNDERGIDLAVLSRFPVQAVRSHIDDDFKAFGKSFKIFSRDCPEFEILLPGGKSLWLLCNHLKSKGHGTQTSNDKKRKRQAERICDILARFHLTTDFVVIAGDLNDTPASLPLKKLLQQTANLFDVLASPLHGASPRWTYSDGDDQIDYLLVSKPLFDRLKAVGIERRGIFHKTNFGGAFPHFPEVTSATTQASDHAAVWADFDI